MHTGLWWIFTSSSCAGSAWQQCQQVEHACVQLQRSVATSCLAHCGCLVASQKGTSNTKYDVYAWLCQQGDQDCEVSCSAALHMLQCGCTAKLAAGPGHVPYCQQQRYGLKARPPACRTAAGDVLAEPQAGPAVQRHLSLAGVLPFRTAYGHLQVASTLVLLCGLKKRSVGGLRSACGHAAVHVQKLVCAGSGLSSGSNLVRPCQYSTTISAAVVAAATLKP